MERPFRRPLGRYEDRQRPLPYGWRVVPAAAFNDLSIVGAPAAGDADKFGWTLGENGNESLFIGAGRRIYRHTQENDTQGGGSIQNFYPTPIDKQVRSSALYNQPWVGYYWTTGTVARNPILGLLFLVRQG